MTLTRLAPGLLATLILTLPAAYFAVPHLERWVHIHWLNAGDIGQRNRGLSYVAAYAAEDARVLAGAVDQLGVADKANFRQIVGALQSAGCWDRTRIPDGLWLRWIGLLARETGAEAPSLAAQRLADMPDLAGDPGVISLLGELLRRDQPDVRYNALCSAAELALSAGDRSAYQRLIADSATDAEPMIARHAWLFGYYLGLPRDDAPAWLNEAIESAKGSPVKDEVFTSGQIRALLLSEYAPLRDVGCVLAVRGLPHGELDILIDELLRDPNDRAGMSGAILFGMTGLHGDVLKQRINNGTDWTTDRVMRLGLWMRDESTDADFNPGLLLAHSDIPRTTVMLAMLHKRETQALDLLLNPRGEAPDDLAVLFDAYGWWRALNHYLPEGAPLWRPDADAGGKQLQIDMLRDWYLVNRHRLNGD